MCIHVISCFCDYISQASLPRWMGVILSILFIVGLIVVGVFMIVNTIETFRAEKLHEFEKQASRLKYASFLYAYYLV